METALERLFLGLLPLRVPTGPGCTPREVPHRHAALPFAGQVITFQFGAVKPYGASYKITPETTESETNVLKCFLINGTKEGPIEPQNVFPNMEGFKVRCPRPGEQRAGGTGQAPRGRYARGTCAQHSSTDIPASSGGPG